MTRLLGAIALGAIITVAVVGAGTQFAAGQALPDTPTPTETETPVPPTETATTEATAAGPTATVAATALPPTGAGATSGDGDSTPWLTIGAVALAGVALATGIFGFRAIRG
jgi:hypothetical protein